MNIVEDKRKPNRKMAVFLFIGLSVPLAGIAGGKVFAWTLVPCGHSTTGTKLGVVTLGSSGYPRVSSVDLV